MKINEFVGGIVGELKIFHFLFFLLIPAVHTGVCVPLDVLV